MSTTDQRHHRIDTEATVDSQQFDPSKPNSSPTS